MNYLAEVLWVGDDIEEEVVLRINEINITCFANVCPLQIHVGLRYWVSITPYISGDYHVREVTERVSIGFHRLNSGFSYDVVGILNEGNLEVDSLVLEDDYLIQEYGHLNQKTVEWKVDRLDVEFLRLDGGQDRDTHK